MTKPTKIKFTNQETHAMVDSDRISHLENHVQQIHVEIAKINTRLDTEIPHLTTKAELREVEGKLSAKIEKSRNSIVIWLIGVAIATGLFNWYSSVPHSRAGVPMAFDQNKSL